MKKRKKRIKKRKASQIVRSQKDAFYRAVFGVKEIVTLLLNDYVPKEIREDFDESTLKNGSASHVSRKMLERHNDLVWEVQTKNGPFHIYLMLEFQSQPDYKMSVRILSYTAALYDKIARAKSFKKGDKLPEILPIVIYSGRFDKDTPTNIDDLVEAPLPARKAYHVNQRHIAIYVQDIDKEVLDTKDDVLSGVFRYEQAKVLDEYKKAIDRFNLALKDKPDLRELVQNRVIKDAQKRGYNVTIDEEDNMGLAEAIDKDREITMAKGVAQGIVKGEARGMAKGAAQSVMTLLGSRFGNVPETLSIQINNVSDVEKLNKLLLSVYEVNSLDEFKKLLN